MAQYEEWGQDEEMERQMDKDMQMGDNVQSAQTDDGKKDAARAREEGKDEVSSSENEHSTGARPTTLERGSKQASKQASKQHYNTIPQLQHDGQSQNLQGSNSQTAEKPEREGPISQRRPRRRVRGEEEQAVPPQQKKRRRTKAGSETIRRVERGTKRRRMVDQIQVSTTTVARTVGGEYEWRVSSYHRERERGKRQRRLTYDDGG